MEQSLKSIKTGNESQHQMTGKVIESNYYEMNKGYTGQKKSPFLYKKNNEVLATSLQLKL